MPAPSDQTRAGIHKSNNEHDTMNTQAKTHSSTRPEADRPPSRPDVDRAHPPPDDDLDAGAGAEAWYGNLFGTPALERETPADVFCTVVSWVRTRPALLGTIRAALRVGERLYYQDGNTEVGAAGGGRQ
jgi:hypothetical protein